MERRALRPRDNWQEVAAEHGFTFHTPDGERYWDETHAYRFTLREIEEDLEDPAEELEQMCFEVVERAVADEQVLRRLAIPETFWGYVVESWRNRERNLYGRMDFRYDGNGPAKLYEYNADTPTALYESAIFQWVWLEQAMEQGIVPEGSDQFNSLHERLIDALSHFGIDGPLHLACARDTDEDLGTVEYLEDCARQAGLGTRRMFIEDIGLAEDGRFTDLDDEPVGWLFKLYPWEWLMEEEFGSRIPGSGTHFIEPGWKAVLSNKGLLAFLWEMFEGHPNLLPTFFEEDPKAASLSAGYVPQAAALQGRREYRLRGKRPHGDAHSQLTSTSCPLPAAPWLNNASRGLTARRVLSARRSRRCPPSRDGDRCAASGWWPANRPACASGRTKAPSPPTTPVSSRISFWTDADAGQPRSASTSSG